MGDDLDDLNLIIVGISFFHSTNAAHVNDDRDLTRIIQIISIAIDGKRSDFENKKESITKVASISHRKFGCKIISTIFCFRFWNVRLGFLNGYIYFIN